MDTVSNKIVNFPLYASDNIGMTLAENVKTFMEEYYYEGANITFVIDSYEMLSTAIGFSMSKRPDLNITMAVHDTFPEAQLLYGHLVSGEKVNVQFFPKGNIF